MILDCSGSGALRVVLNWDKKKNDRPRKSGKLLGVLAAPAIWSAKQWFDHIDAVRLRSSYDLSPDDDVQPELVLPCLCMLALNGSCLPLQDKSGELDSSELATLYKQARGEKLSGRELKTAMACMDADKSGTIEFSEFEAWSVLAAVVHLKQSVLV